MHSRYVTWLYFKYWWRLMDWGPRKKISVFLQCKLISNKTNNYTTNNNCFSYWKYISIYTYPIYIMFHVFSLFTHIDRAKDMYRRFYANELIKMHKMSIFYTEKCLINIIMPRIFPLKSMKHINETRSLQEHILFNFK